jgi:hypothetical protein
METLHGTRELVEIITTIAQAAHLDLTKVGASVTIRNCAWSPLTITVQAPGIVLVGHYETDKEGRRWADPAMTFYVATADGAWIPLTYGHDYAEEHRRVATVTGGTVTVRDRIGLARLRTFCRHWATRLRHEGYTYAAAHPEECSQVPPRPKRWKW